MKIDHLDGLLALKVIAETKNFKSASDKFGISPSAISQIIKKLENRLGVVLLSRNTRSTSLTQAGKQFLEMVGPALDQINYAIDDIGSFADKPSGLLRLNIPKLAYSTYLAPIIASFIEKYPDISLDLTLEDRQADVVAEGFDAGIRLSDILANNVTALKIKGPIKFLAIASPNYLEKYGRPNHPKELFNHICICPKLDSGPYNRWEFEEDGKEFSTQVKPTIIMNDSELILKSAIDGLGIAYMMKDAAIDFVKQGKLEFLFEDFAASSAGFYLYYPNPSQVMPKLRAFIDHIQSERKLLR